MELFGTKSKVIEKNSKNSKWNGLILCIISVVIENGSLPGTLASAVPRCGGWARRHAVVVVVVAITVWTRGNVLSQFILKN